MRTNTSNKFILLLILIIFLIPVSPESMEAANAINFDEIGRETARILADLIRIDTTNPPGNESLVADYLAKLLDREGIHYLRVARDEGRDNFIARYHGSGKYEPLLLYSHSDVVPADAGWGVWTVDPFAGIVQDEAIYGRGAIDAKGLLACHLATMLILKRNNIPLDRDVIFLVAAAEETGGGPGVSWLLEEKRELIDAGAAIGEGGRVWERADSVWSAWIQAGEKSAHNLTVTALGESGHASVPSDQNAIYRLTKALIAIKAYQFPARQLDLTSEFFKRLAQYDERIQQGHPRFEALRQNTISITLIEGGVKTNVIPDFAQANLNLRILPEENLEDVTKSLEYAANDTLIRVRHKPGVKNGATMVPFNTTFFTTIEDAIHKLYPQAVTAPYLTPATSDASKLRRAGILTYGLLPFPLTEEESNGVHGIDERVRLKNLTLGVRLTYEIVISWAGKSVEPKKN